MATEGSRIDSMFLAPPHPVKISHKKDGHRRQPHRFHVSCSPPPPHGCWIHYRDLSMPTQISLFFFFYKKDMLNISLKISSCLSSFQKNNFWYFWSWCYHDIELNKCNELFNIIRRVKHHMYLRKLIAWNEMSHEVVQMSQCRDIPGLPHDERLDVTLIRDISFTVQTMWTGCWCRSETQHVAVFTPTVNVDLALTLLNQFRTQLNFDARVDADAETWFERCSWNPTHSFQASMREPVLTFGVNGP